MNIEELRIFALSLQDTEECLPFDESTLVYKAAGKMFLLASVDSFPLQINVKCDPERAILLRAQYSSILPGYHMNKKHWNSIIIDNSVPDSLILELILHSYELVLPKKKK